MALMFVFKLCGTLATFLSVARTQCAVDSGCLFPTGQFAVRGDCRVFVNCMDCRAHLQQCAAGTLFDSRVSACNHAHLVTDCGTSGPLVYGALAQQEEPVAARRFVQAIASATESIQHLVPASSIGFQSTTGPWRSQPPLSNSFGGSERASPKGPLLLIMPPLPPFHAFAPAALAPPSGAMFHRQPVRPLTQLPPSAAVPPSRIPAPAANTGVGLEAAAVLPAAAATTRPTNFIGPGKWRDDEALQRRQGVLLEDVATALSNQETQQVASTKTPNALDEDSINPRTTTSTFDVNARVQPASGYVPSVVLALMQDPVDASPKRPRSDYGSRITNQELPRVVNSTIDADSSTRAADSPPAALQKGDRALKDADGEVRCGTDDCVVRVAPPVGELSASLSRTENVTGIQPPAKSYPPDHRQEQPPFVRRHDSHRGSSTRKPHLPGLAPSGPTPSVIQLLQGAVPTANLPLHEHRTRRREHSENGSNATEEHRPANSTMTSATQLHIGQVVGQAVNGKETLVTDVKPDFETRPGGASLEPSSALQPTPVAAPLTGPRQAGQFPVTPRSTDLPSEEDQSKPPAVRQFESRQRIGSPTSDQELAVPQGPPKAPLAIRKPRVPEDGSFTSRNADAAVTQQSTQNEAGEFVHLGYRFDHNPLVDI